MKIIAREERMQTCECILWESSSTNKALVSCQWMKFALLPVFTARMLLWYSHTNFNFLQSIIVAAIAKEVELNGWNRDWMTLEALNIYSLALYKNRDVKSLMYI